ncbi:MULTISPECIES: radical SAM protein [unclassified Oceanobacter]|uniref:B12-binding domain-containing radical SAM protein n=1 Tax=unclassified Oceanobacter TaxID=2620260 RepID=UPI0027323302|nr:MULTISPECIES: radical SAM protein [unclassified Oceanobacter]MDP2505579.1 radical SAM protein [Oceanobacter sp. 3_MG-2023]MDP2547161.1 radical SAM protein [Oceanobacter sp. 4_MG-2023]
MNKHIVFISVDWERPQDGRSNLGAASILASLKNAGIHYTLIEDAVNATDFNYTQLESMVLAAINCLEVQGISCLIGIGAYIWNEPVTQQLTEVIHNSTAVPVVLGGPQISYADVGLLEVLYPYANIFVRGYGEQAMVALARGENLQGLGIHFAGETDLGQKAETELKQLSSPWLSGVMEIGKSIRWETMRGCPFRCAFCQHRESSDRFKLVEQALNYERISKEARLFAQTGVERISILDPIFHLDTKRSVDLLTLFKEVGLTAQITLQCRFELIKDEFIDVLEGLNVVLEFGLQTAIAEEGNAIGRPNNLGMAEQVITKLKARNIPFEVSLIYGLPKQTLASFRQSLTWCWNQQVPVIRAWPLMILRGTPLDKQREKFGLIESEDHAIPHVIASNSFSYSDYLQMEVLAQVMNQFEV